MFSKRSASIFSFSDCQRLCFFGIPFKCWSPTVPPQWPISLLFLCLLNKFSTLWGARWRRGFRTTTPLYSIPSLSSVSLAPSFFFSFISNEVLLFWLPLMVTLLHLLSAFFLLCLCLLSSNSHIFCQPAVSSAMWSPVGSLGLDQGWTL